MKKILSVLCCSAYRVPLYRSNLLVGSIFNFEDAIDWQSSQNKSEIRRNLVANAESNVLSRGFMAGP